VKEEYIFWVVCVTLFMGGLGFPVPENPLLMGAGYGLYQKTISPFYGLFFCFLSILSGDFILFASIRLIFRSPRFSYKVKEWVGRERYDKCQSAFYNWGGWTLFIARFTFGLRAAAYVAAGAMKYPWIRFVIFDCISVGIQVILFMGLGYFAGDEIQEITHTSEKILLFITIAALLTIIITVFFNFIVKRMASRGN
jgi:membrane protein DedA with SNARE-associated domain